MNLSDLNAQFGIAGKLTFVEGKGGLINAEITAANASAVVATYAAQVLSFTPKDQEDVLFVSENAHYKVGKATKGGVPICWPWFGPDPEDKGRPAHGFVRNRQWEVLETQEDGDAVIIRLGVPKSDDIKEIWEHDTDLSICIRVDSALNIELVTQNNGADAIKITQALHTYFSIGDIGQVSVQGLEDKTYIDKLDQGLEKVQDRAVAVVDSVDRIYLDVANDMTITDQAKARKILIQSEGSNSVVVWNPWSEIAAQMGDLGDDDYKIFLCVETVNAGPDEVTVAGGESYTLKATYSVSDI